MEDDTKKGPNNCLRRDGLPCREASIAAPGIAMTVIGSLVIPKQGGSCMLRKHLLAIVVIVVGTAVLGSAVLAEDRDDHGGRKVTGNVNATITNTPNVNVVNT